MKTLVVYFTKFGNTQSVAEAINLQMNTMGPSKTVHLEELLPADFDEIDLIVMGSPTHRMNIPESVRPLLENLPRGSLKGKQVAAFDTSYKMNSFLARMTAAKKIDRKLRRLGGKQIVPPETFHVEDREGPLYPGELERARDWAETLAIATKFLK